MSFDRIPNIGHTSQSSFGEGSVCSHEDGSVCFLFMFTYKGFIDRI